MAKIDSITLYWSDNYVKYDDTDISTDYVNAYSLGLKQTIEWVKLYGADVIRVRAASNDPKYQKRVARIAKATGRKVMPDGACWLLAA